MAKNKEIIKSRNKTKNLYENNAHSVNGITVNGK